MFMRSSPLNPFTIREVKTALTILEIFFLQTHFFLKHFKEKYLSEDRQQPSFKYIVNFPLIPKLFSNVWE